MVLQGVMKKLLNNFITIKHSASHCLRVLCLLFFSFSIDVYAQTNNQVSYPVKLQVEHTAASSAVPVQQVKAPEPVIRPIEQAASIPTKTKITPTKKTQADIKKSVSVNKASKPKKTDTKSATKTIKTEVNTKKTVTNNKKVNTVKSTTKKVVEQPKIEKIQQNKSIQTRTVAVKKAQQTSSIAASKFTQEHNKTTFVSDSATQAAVVRILDEAPTNDEGIDESADEIDSLYSVNTASTQKNISPVSDSDDKEAFVKEFEEYVESKLVPTLPGAALAIIAGGKVKVLAGYGIKRYGGRDKVDTETLFRLASVSKTIASSAAAKLVQDGFVSWNTTVTSVLPNVEFKNARYGDQLTIKHILSQSTGLPSHTQDNFIEEGMSFNDVVHRLRYVNFICPPGKCYTYQNVAYSLISPIIYKKTGKTYEQYVTEKLFRPLGMRTASFGLDNLRATNNYTQPHTKTRGGWAVEVVNENYYRVNPAAGANASITDMSRWVLAHMGQYPEVLPPAMLRTIHEKTTRNSYYSAHEGVTDIHYALGWRSFDYRGDKNFMHHGGSVLGFRSEMVFNAELKIGMVILSNSNRLPGSVVFKFLDAYEDHKRGKRPIVPAKKEKSKK